MVTSSHLIFHDQLPARFVLVKSLFLRKSGFHYQRNVFAFKNSQKLHAFVAIQIPVNHFISNFFRK